MKPVRLWRRQRSWRYAQRAQHIHLALVHPDGAVDCVCERSVWFFRKGKALGHSHHCSTCHPRYKEYQVRAKVKCFMTRYGLVPLNWQTNPKVSA